MASSQAGAGALAYVSLVLQSGLERQLPEVFVLHLRNAGTRRGRRPIVWKTTAVRVALVTCLEHSLFEEDY